MTTTNVDLLTPYERGRMAFWASRPIWANPFVDRQAAEWRVGWHAAQAQFLERGGRERTVAELSRLRPADVDGGSAYRKKTKQGAARDRAEEMRDGGSEWY